MTPVNPGPQLDRSDVVLREILVYLQDPKVLRDLDHRTGTLIINWAGGHLTYFEIQKPYKRDVDMYAPRSEMVA